MGNGERSKWGSYSDWKLVYKESLVMPGVVLNIVRGRVIATTVVRHSRAPKSVVLLTIHDFDLGRQSEAAGHPRITAGGHAKGPIWLLINQNLRMN